ncbi:hypothetical protein BS17DRAFT_818844 [Gyrodon lividus]|nr:hypothetical protein BS17DRAFT_818844 [Gyrodon lividus]
MSKMPHPSEEQQLLHELDMATQFIQAIQHHEQELDELAEISSSESDSSFDILPGFMVITTPSPASPLALFDALLSIHQASNLASAFYIFQQLFTSAWSGARLAGMKFMVNTRLLTFVLLNSLPKTPEWNMFTSSIVNTIEDSQLTFNAMEIWITLEEACLNPSGPWDSTLKVSNKSSTCPPNSTAWCKHHQQSGHNSDNCYAYQHRTKELRKGGGKKWEKKEKANMMEDAPEVTPKTLEIENIVTKGASGRNTIVIDSKATSHMVPHQSWFQTYSQLVPPAC